MGDSQGAAGVGSPQAPWPVLCASACAALLLSCWPGVGRAFGVVAHGVRFALFVPGYVVPDRAKTGMACRELVHLSRGPAFHMRVQREQVFPGNVP